MLPDVISNEVVPTKSSREDTLPTKNLPTLPESQVDTLIAMAIDRQVSVEALERLLAMRRELRAEHAKEQYDTAMSHFQSICPVIKKTKEVWSTSGQLLYSYAPIDSIVSQVRHLLKEYGLSYAINTETLDNSVRVTCTTKHTAGHSEVSTMQVPLGTKTNAMSNTQVVAAAITFAKRYAFCNGFGILTGDDDTDSRVEGVTHNSTVYITENQMEEILTLLGEQGLSKDQLLKAAKVDSIEKLTQDYASRVIVRLRERQI